MKSTNLAESRYYPSTNIRPAWKKGDKDKQDEKKPPAIDDTKALALAKKERDELFTLADKGDHEGMLAFIDGKKSVFEADDKGMTALMLASAKGHRRVVLVLTNHLTKQAQHEYFRRADQDGKNALMHAAAEGKIEAIECLFATLDHQWKIGQVNWFEFLETKDKAGKRADELAADAGQKETAERIEAEYAKLLNVRRGTDERTALEVAAEKGQLAIVEKLLKRKANLEPQPAPDASGSYRASALALAAVKGHILVVEAILISIPDAKERTKHVNLGYYDQREKIFGTILRQTINPEIAALLKKHRAK